MTFSFRSAAAVAVLAITTFGAAAPALAQSDVGAAKFFEVRFSPEFAAPKSDFKYAVVVKNDEVSRQTLGAVNLTAPAGFLLKATTAGTIEGSTVQLRKELRPGETQELTITVDNSGGDADSTWKADGRQANKFSGEGNKFVLWPEPKSSLKTGVGEKTEKHCNEGVSEEICKLSMTWQGTGPLYGAHSELPDPRLPVSGPGQAASRSASLGVLPTDTPERGTTTYTVTVTVTAFPNSLLSDNGMLSLKLPAADADCELNTETSPKTALVDGPVNRAKTVKFYVDGAEPLASPSQGMCYGAPVPFATSPLRPVLTAGEYDAEVLPGGVPSVFFFGTLPDCSGETSALRSATPCTSTRRLDANLNQETVTQVPATHLDPAYRP